MYQRNSVHRVTQSRTQMKQFSMHAHSMYVFVCVCLYIFIYIWLVARQSPLSMGFSGQEYWSGLLCSPPGGLPNPGVEPKSLMSPTLAGRFFTTSTTWEGYTCVCVYIYTYIHIYISFYFFPTMVYLRILIIVPCAIQ